MLKVDQSHKKANLSSIKNKLIYRRIASGIAALFISASLVMSSPKAYAYDENFDNTQVIVINENVDIPDGKSKSYIYYYSEKEETENITIDDLQKLDTVYLSLDQDIDWFKYCTNVSNLTLVCKNASNLEKLKSINSSSKYQSIALNCSGLELNEEHLFFLINSPNIKKLTLHSNTYIKDGILSKMHSLDTIELMMEYNGNLNINSHDFKKIPNLKNIHMGNWFIKPYTLATVIEKEVLDKCQFSPSEDAKDSFDFMYGTYEKTYMEYLTDAVNQLDEIYKSLNINENMSDTEKLNKILIYVITNLTYDEQISYYLKNNIEHSGETNKFYELGNLYAALTKDSAICGNYAALFQALALRAGIDTYSVSGYAGTGEERGIPHAWNLVKINDEYYYVDATFLDSEIITQEEIIQDEDDNTFGYSIHWKILDEKEGETVKADMINRGDTEELKYYLFDAENSDRSLTTSPIDFELLNKDKEKQTILATDTSKENNEIIINETSSEENAKDITHSKFKFIIDNKVYFISGAAAIGFLSFAGLAIKARNNRLKKSHYYDQEYDYNDYDDYNNTYSRRY